MTTTTHNNGTSSSTNRDGQSQNVSVQDIYRTLDLSQGQIRVIDILPGGSHGLDNDLIRCCMRRISLNSPEAYTALSYTWGDPKVTAPVFIGDTEIQVTTNLASALRHLRHQTNKLTFWIDAICINQRSTAERNAQVLLMSRIYSAAVKVIVWLGEEQYDSPLAINLIEKWTFWAQPDPDTDYQTAVTEAEAKQSEETMAALFEEKAWDAVRALFWRPWWRRIWVFQEVVLAKVVYVTCGHACITWEALSDAKRLWDRLTEPQFSRMIWNDRLGLIHRTIANGFMPAMMQRRSNQQLNRPAPPLLNLLLACETYEATDPRDKLYALLGLSSDGFDLVQPDYSLPVEQVYSDLSRRMIEQTHRLDIVEVAGVGGLEATSTLALPSWVKDWRSPHDRGIQTLETLRLRPGVYHAASNTPATIRFSPDSRAIHLQGILFDSVQTVIAPRFLYEDRPPFWKDWALQSSDKQYPTGIPYFQAFFRAILHDYNPLTNQRLSATDPTFFELAAAYLAFWDKTGLESHGYVTTDPDYVTRFLAWLGQDRNGRSDEEILEVFTGPRSCASALTWPTTLDREIGMDRRTVFFRAVAAATAHRSFVITSRGYMGLAPPGVADGDLVCVFAGCDVPLVLRQLGDRCVLVGQCFVVGLMDGEAMEGLDAGQLRLQSFEIR